MFNSTCQGVNIIYDFHLNSLQVPGSWNLHMITFKCRERNIHMSQISTDLFELKFSPYATEIMAPYVM